jgi:hypothetical protein
LGLDWPGRLTAGVLGALAAGVTATAGCCRADGATAGETLVGGSAAGGSTAGGVAAREAKAGVAEEATGGYDAINATGR